MPKLMRPILTSLTSMSLVVVVACGSSDDGGASAAAVDDSTNTPSSTPPPDELPSENGMKWSSVTISDRDTDLIQEDPVTTPDPNCFYQHTFQAVNTSEVRVGINCEYEWTSRLTDEELTQLQNLMSQLSLTEARSDLNCRPRTESDSETKFIVRSTAGRNYTVYDSTTSSENSTPPQTCITANEAEILAVLSHLDALRAKYNTPSVQNPR